MGAGENATGPLYIYTGMTLLKIQTSYYNIQLDHHTYIGKDWPFHYIRAVVAILILFSLGRSTDA